MLLSMNMYQFIAILLRLRFVCDIGLRVMRNE